MLKYVAILIYSVNKKKLLMKVVTAVNGLVQSFLTGSNFVPHPSRGYLAMFGNFLDVMNGRRL